MTDGLTRLPSSHAPAETMERLVAILTRRGMSVFARIDHAKAAADVGMALRPTELILFGKAQAGTPLMQAVQTIGIDLPLKALVWEDEAGRTWLGYNDPAWLARRHGVEGEAAKPVRGMSDALTAICQEAAAP